MCKELQERLDADTYLSNVVGLSIFTIPTLLLPHLLPCLWHERRTVRHLATSMSFARSLMKKRQRFSVLDPAFLLRCDCETAVEIQIILVKHHGYCYENGTGVAHDPAEVARWYRLAADQGHAAAQCNMGICYASGIGVAQDDAKSVRWYRLSADQGFAAAQCIMGQCYLNGTGVVRDPAEALRWVHLSADQGFAEAKTALTTLANMGHSNK
jgi:hypothetical protein